MPLKPGEGNTLKVSLTGETVVLTLNDVEIYERVLDPRNNRIFGLFHWKDRTAVEVRNVVLRGDWPETLTAEQLANLVMREEGVASTEN